MPQPNPPQDPHATVKMIPGAMFETNEFSADEIVEQLAARRAAEAAKAVPKAAPETGQDQAGPIQPPPSTSSSR